MFFLNLTARMGFILIPGNTFVSVAKLCQKYHRCQLGQPLQISIATKASTEVFCLSHPTSRELKVTDSLLLFDLSKPFFLNICWQMYALKIFEDFHRLQDCSKQTK